MADLDRDSLADHEGTSIRTFDPLGVHLDDLIDELDGLAAFALGLADLLCISALAVYEGCYVERHCVWRWLRSVLGRSIFYLSNSSSHRCDSRVT
jgi:hypothetical protein